MHCGNDSMHGENVLSVMKIMSELKNILYLMQSVTNRFHIASNEIEMVVHCGNDYLSEENVLNVMKIVKS